MNTTGPVMTVTDELLAELELHYRSVNDDSRALLICELRRLRAENAELAKDAGRYRWMCSVKGLSVASDGSTWTRQDGRSYVSAHTLCANGSQYAGRETLSEAIDTAMAAQ